MNSVGKFLIITGVAITLVGIGIIVFSRLKIPFLGRMPGDIFIQKKNFIFYFPFTTCLIISVILSLILYFIFKGNR
jgi:uncharacterized protein HemY